jgi:BMFP domain-containing protein YqiC
MLLTAFFASNGTPTTGLTPHITVWGEDGSAIVSSDLMTEVAGGFYKYNLGGFDNDRTYFIRADGGAGLSAADRYVYSTNPPVGGGGLALTGDMMFMLKRMADNVTTKKEMKEIMKGFIASVSGLNTEHIKSTSKMNENTVEMTVASLKSEFSKFSEMFAKTMKQLDSKKELNALQERISKLEQSHNNSAQAISKFSTDNLEKIKQFNDKVSGLVKQIDQRKKDLEDAVSKEIEKKLLSLQVSSPEKSEIIEEMKNDIRYKLDSVKNGLTTLSKDLSEMQSKAATKRDIDYLSVTVEEKISHVNEKITETNNFSKKKFSELSRRNSPDDTYSQLQLLGIGDGNEQS